MPSRALRRDSGSPLTIRSIVAATVTTAMLVITVACAQESAPADRLLDEFEHGSTLRER